MHPFEDRMETSEEIHMSAPVEANQPTVQLSGVDRCAEFGSDIIKAIRCIDELTQAIGVRGW